MDIRKTSVTLLSFLLLLNIFLGLGIGGVALQVSADSGPFTIGTTTSSTSLAWNNQRKIFGAKYQIWSWYSNGTHMGYQRSSNGVTFGSFIAIRACTDGKRFAVDSNGTHVAYVYTTSAGSYRYLYYRLGRLNVNGTITWAKAEQSEYYLSGDRIYPAIRFDSAGYVWLAIRDESAAGSELLVARTGRDGAFNSSSILYGQWVVLGHVSGGITEYSTVILQLPNQKMYFLMSGSNRYLYGRLFSYIPGGTPAGKGYDDDFTPNLGPVPQNPEQVSTYALPTEAPYTAFDAISINSTIYLAYFSWSYEGFGFKKKTVGGSWSSETGKGAPGLYPTMSYRSDVNLIYTVSKEQSIFGNTVWKIAWTPANPSPTGSFAEWFTDSDGFAYDYVFSAFRNDQYNPGAVVFSYQTKTSTPYDIKIRILGSWMQAIELLGISINNMEGCGNWLFSGTKYYNFKLSFHIGFDQVLDTIGLNFTDTWNVLTFYYDYSSSKTTQVSGTDCSVSGGVTYTRQGVAGANLNLTIPVNLNQRVLDAYDVDIWGFGNTTEGYVNSWQNGAPDYFNIYSSGGLTKYAFTGTGGKRYDGGPWELYAGGYYAPSAETIFYDEFAGTSFQRQWVVNSFTDENSENAIRVVNYPVKTPFFSLRLDDAATGSPYPYIWGNLTLNGRNQWQNFTIMLWLRADQVDNGYSILFVDGYNSTNSGKLTAIRLGYTTDYNRFYVDTTDITGEDSTVPTAATATATTWYNITLFLDFTHKLQTLYIDGVNVANQWNFAYQFTNATNFRVEVNYQTTGTHRTMYIDDVSIYRATPGGYGGTSTGIAYYRKIQRFQLEYAIAIPQGTQNNAIDDMGAGTVEWGIDYCDPVTHQWINNTLSARVQILSGKIDAQNNWIQLQVSWYVRGVYHTAEQITVFWEGAYTGNWLGGWEVFRLHTDLWFSITNGSRLVGGRVQSYYYGVQDNSNPWFRWWTGTNFGPVSLGVSSTFIHPLENNSSNVISAQSLDLMRIRGKVTRDTSKQYQWLIRDFNVFQPQTTVGIMTGIPDPSPSETKMPVGLNVRGISGYLWEGLLIGMGNLVSTIVFGIIGFLDRIFGFFGWQGGFSQVLAWLRDFLSLLPQAFTWMINLLVSIFQVLTTSLPLFLVFLVTLISTSLTIFSVLVGLYGAITGFFASVWSFIAPFWQIVLEIAPFGVLLYIIYLLYLAGNGKGDQAWQQIKWIWSFINLVARVVERLFFLFYRLGTIFFQILMGLLDVV